MIEVSPVKDGVALLTLDRPEKKNALSIDLRDRISDALDELATDDELRCLVITGRGNVFCAGFDLSEFAVTDDGFQERLWASSDRYHTTVARFPLPTIAAINGAAIAGGFDLAVLCDLRVAAETATFSHPERSFGDVVYAPLHDLVGGAVARDLCFTGRVVDGSEAHRLGVVNRVVAVDDVVASALTLAAEVAAAPRDVLVRLKAKALRRSGVAPTTVTLDL